jgi:isocitrate dehydrogenase kinase/phosphatase
VKTVTRKEVLEKYRWVYKHDKYGRLADTHEFDNLTLLRDTFTPALLEELLMVASRSVKLKGERVLIKHTFTERKMCPLNLFIEENPLDFVKKVIVDFGNALKELAYANIFPGDLLMKNFGVTRDYRVVFYDYDEITFVTSCNFRQIPLPQNNEELYAVQPMYEVKPNDIFPEEFKNYLLPQGELRNILIDSHPELFQVSFWEEVKQMHLKGHPFEIISYDKRNCLR